MSDGVGAELVPMAYADGMALHDMLAARRDDVMRRWNAQVRGTLAPEAMPPLELADHIPEFVDEIASALRRDAGVSSPGPSPEQSATAAVHGAQRLRLGFSLDSVVREYGALRDAIMNTARDTGEQPTFRELQVLFDAIVAGIAQAVSEYTRQRDAELVRQGNEHFAFIAHELRNPLSSAVMAFNLLSGKGQLPAENRTVGALERGLRRTSDLIDQTLEMTRVASGIELKRQETTLKDLFDDVELGAVSEAESKGVEIRALVEKDERLMLDTRLVRSALGNLLLHSCASTSARADSAWASLSPNRRSTRTAAASASRTFLGGAVFSCSSCPSASRSSGWLQGGDG